MKARIIGALYVLLFFGLGFFWKGEIFFRPIIIVWLVLAAAELYVSDFLVGGKSGANPKFASSVAFAQCFILLAIITCALTEDYRVLGLAVAACFVSDTCGFIIGKLFGKGNKVSALREISPNKSIAGFIGAIAIAAPLVYVIALLLSLNESYGTARIVVFAGMAGFCAATGDLIGSASKRALGVKDSGEDLAKFPIFRFLEKPLIGGHGGYYDRMDSICAVLVLAWTIFHDIAPP
ncbi:phosphatidate cytidylyltransferase [Candidatus Saccharibacteria bacterium]|nr:phosphatidate cytidylyltransferase [Candidatus Saccharibacteria bacterium]